MKPVLESIGSVMSWVSEKAGGYGNLAKFMGALYLGNKVLRNDKVQTLGGWGWSGAKWGYNKIFNRKKGGAGGLADGVAGALGATVGVTPVYVTNFPMGFGGGGGGGYGYDVIEDGRDKDKKTQRKTNHQDQNEDVVVCVPLLQQWQLLRLPCLRLLHLLPLPQAVWHVPWAMA